MKKQTIQIMMTALIFSIQFFPVVYAETYYVNNTATDSVVFESATDIASPCSPATAFVNAVAGDTIYFLEGKYDTSVSTDWAPRYHAKWRPANSGTQENPIIFAANPGDQVIINGVVDPAEDEIRVFSTGSQDYIIFDGFIIQANDGNDIGSIIIGYNSYDWDITSDGCIIRNCVFHNNGTKIITTLDNREPIRIEWTKNTLVENCKIYNVRQEGNGQIDWHNASGIKMYHNQDTIIQNCEISNCSTGMYDKSEGLGTIFRYNYVHNCSNGYFVDTNFNHPDNEIYHNMFSNQERNHFSSPPGGTSRSDNLKFYNNTFYTGIIKANSVSLRSGSDLQFYNNLFYGMPLNGDLGMLRFYTSDATQMTILKCDHNQFGDMENSFQVSVYRESQTSYQRYYSLTDWQLSSELSSGGSPGNNSLASDPLFENESGNLDMLSDFALNTQSPCKGTGEGGVDMGAAVESVGVDPDVLPDYDPEDTGIGNEEDTSGGGSGGGCFLSIN